jgi:hypothetical protein
MHPVAVGICIDCPVREPCLDEAIRTGDSGVVRGATLFIRGHRRTSALSLICTICQRRPVHISATGHSLYCGPTCAARASATVSTSMRRRHAEVARRH